MHDDSDAKHSLRDFIETYVTADAAAGDGTAIRADLPLHCSLHCALRGVTLELQGGTPPSARSDSMVLKVAIAGATSRALGVHVSRAFTKRWADFDIKLLVRKSTLVRV